MEKKEKTCAELRRMLDTPFLGDTQREILAAIIDYVESACRTENERERRVPAPLSERAESLESKGEPKEGDLVVFQYGPLGLWTLGRYVERKDINDAELHMVQAAPGCNCVVPKAYRMGDFDPALVASAK